MNTYSTNCPISGTIDLQLLYFYIQKDKKIHTLDVSGNDIGPLGVMYLAEMLLENSTLYELVSITGIIGEVSETV